MSQKLNITLVQTDIKWMDAKANLEFLDSQIQLLKTDLIVLPEMFNTGFSMQPHLTAESMEGNTVNWMKKTALQLNTAICGSISIKDDSKYYNRFIFIYPNQKIVFYDKKHLFTYGGEHNSFDAGEQTITIDYKSFKIRPFICYDLRFPVWNRNTNEYDIALYVANWPAKRAHAWNSLLMARAIENMCFVVAVNRLGIDGNKLRYQGDSKVISPMGNIVTECKDQLQMCQLNIDKDLVHKSREQFSFLKDQDPFTFI